MPRSRKRSNFESWHNYRLPELIADSTRLSTLKINPFQPDIETIFCTSDGCDNVPTEPTLQAQNTQSLEPACFLYPALSTERSFR